MSNLLASSVPKPFDIPDIFRNIASRWYVYLVIGVLSVLLLLVLLLKKQRRNLLNNTQKIVYTSILSGFAFLANWLTIPINNGLTQISFIATIGFIAGYLLGPGLGFTAAFIGDLICGIVAPLGVYSPVIGLGSGLMAYIPGVIFERVKLNDYIKLAISYLATTIVASIFVNNIGLSLLYGWPIDFSIVARLPFIFLGAGINCAISYALIPVFPRILPKDKFPFVAK